MFLPYLLFIGSGLYLFNAVLYFWLWTRTMRKVDGTGLYFLQILTFSLSLGSFIVFIVRVLSEYGSLGILEARAIAVVNPLLLLGVGLWLNYFIHCQKNK